MRTLPIKELQDSEIRAHINDLRYSGYTIIEEFLPKNTVSFLLSLVDLHVSDNTDLINVSKNQAIDDYVYNLQFKDHRFLHPFSRSKILQILQPFLNDPYYSQIPKSNPNFVLGYYNARSSVAPLELHIDSYFPSISNYTNSMQISFSLSGQSERNGATCVVPGSHMLNRYPDRSSNISSLAVLECDPGAAIIWDSRLWHGALENLSGEKRWSLVATFRPWWAKQNYDPVSGLPEAIYSELNDVEKGLLGFLSLPPRDEREKVALKEGYESLLESVGDYKMNRR